MPTVHRTNAERARPFSRAVRWGIALSALLHVLVFLAFRGERVPDVPEAAAGPDAGDALAAAGGAMQAVQLRVAEVQPIPRPPEPILVPDAEVEPVEEEPTEIEPVDLAALPQPGTARGETTGERAGRENASGRGNAGTAERGSSRVMAPNPRSIIMPPTDAPRGARGRTISIYVFVDERGRVVPDSTRVIPSSGDRGFDRKLRGRANEWVFDPARREGRVVAEWFSYSFAVDG